jgi:cob(I)alamin adenosyltransferase
VSGVPDEPRLCKPTRPPYARARSLVLVNTGDGKGKSTAAFGVLMRAVARGWPVAVVQFIKSGRWRTGEERLGRQLGVDWWKLGDGFSWESDDLERSRLAAEAAWRHAEATIRAGAHRLVVLDEVTYPMTWGWISTDDVVRTLRERPEHVNVVATGRNAPQALVEAADTATEMRKLRHAYDRGVRGRRGIDF